MHQIVSFWLGLCALWAPLADAKRNDPCTNVKCPEGTICKVIGGERTLCAVNWNKCRRKCPEGYECRKEICTCNSDACMKQCGSFRCAVDQECVEDPYGKKRCCVTDCSSRLAWYMFKRPEPICGEDGVTYESLCFFEKDKCFRGDVDALPSVFGDECRQTGQKCGNRVCASKEICTKSDAGFRCCEATCPDTVSHVCGDDGHLHRNLCQLDRTACLTGQKINIVPIDGCLQRCRLGSIGTFVPSGKVFTLLDGCTKCECNNGHWHCDYGQCLQ
eukprot:m.308525 g.308525  ORF g.308525 m.308525 type:complete len:274 (+) comp44157_c0_seq1:1022-1843(+)